MNSKQKVVFFLFGLSLCFSSTAFAGYHNNRSQETYRTPERNYTGLYLGGGLGSVLPVGDGTEGVIAGGGWAIEDISNLVEI